MILLCTELALAFLGEKDSYYLFSVTGIHEHGSPLKLSSLPPSYYLLNNLLSDSYENTMRLVEPSLVKPVTLRSNKELHWFFPLLADTKSQATFFVAYDWTIRPSRFPKYDA